MIRKWIRSKLLGVNLWLDNIAGSLILHRALSAAFEMFVQRLSTPHDEDDVAIRYASARTPPHTPPDRTTHYFYGDGCLYDYVKAGWRFSMGVEDERWMFSSRKVTR